MGPPDFHAPKMKMPLRRAAAPSRDHRGGAAPCRMVQLMEAPISHPGAQAKSDRGGSRRAITQRRRRSMWRLSYPMIPPNQLLLKPLAIAG